MTRVHVLERGKHWETMDDLGELVGTVAAVVRLWRTDSMDIHARFIDRHRTGSALVAVYSVPDERLGIVKGLRIDTRCEVAITSGLESALTEANSVAESAFEGMLAADDRTRFRVDAGTT